MEINNTSNKHNTKKIFVTGATGYVGRNLVNSLIENGVKVYTLTRKETSIFSNNKNVIEMVGDITDNISLPLGTDTIYHCAGVIYHPEEMEKVNVLGTKNIVEIALKNNCKLIYLSSAGIIGKTNATILDENTACNPQNAYEISKYKAEQIVLRAINNGLNAQILRPTTIFGYKENPQKDTFFQLVKSMRTDFYKNIGDGVYNIIHIDEVIKALELLDKENLKNGEIFLINNHIKYKDIDKIIKNIKPIITKKTQTIPYFFAYIITLILTLVYSIINKKSPLTFSRLRALTNKKIYSQDKIIKDISFQNTLPIEKYIEKVCKEYIDLKLLP
ncbi:MAG: NAD-dependent epimerase/dehydratase family protein [archaeon]|nr:NAD-dependent epimerase/dehydratase family protein [archaeon]